MRASKRIASSLAGSVAGSGSLSDAYFFPRAAPTPTQTRVVERLFSGLASGSFAGFGLPLVVINGILWRTENSAKWAPGPGPVWAVEDVLPPLFAVGTGRDLGQDRAAVANRRGRRRESRLACAGRLDHRACPSERCRRQQKGLTATESRTAQGIGCSRGGLTSKLHLLAEGRGRSLVTRIVAGQASDTRSWWR
jgi:hypothetical protein